MTASALYSWLFRIQTHGLIAKRQDHEPTVSHVFISHAAPDKLLRVKPLVHALAIEGVRLWLDRPGAGDSHLNFDEEFIHRHGIEAVDDLGRPFDPHRHEAVALGNDPRQPDDVILKVIQRGYCRGDKVFRPAKVIVNDPGHPPGGGRAR